MHHHDFMYQNTRSRNPSISIHEIFGWMVWPRTYPLICGLPTRSRRQIKRRQTGWCIYLFFLSSALTAMPQTDESSQWCTYTIIHLLFDQRGCQQRQYRMTTTDAWQQKLWWCLWRKRNSFIFLSASFGFNFTVKSLTEENPVGWAVECSLFFLGPKSQGPELCWRSGANGPYEV